MSMRRDAQARESATYWHDASLGNLELLKASFVTHAFAPHTHEGFAIGVIELGAETFTYRRQLRVAPAGSIVLINPGEMHTGEALTTEQGWRYRMLYPDAPMLQRAASEVMGHNAGVPFFPEPVVHDARLARLLLYLHAALEAGESQLERESRLLWTMAQLVVRYADDRPSIRPARGEQDLAARVRAHLQQHLSENVTLNDLSREINMSAFHLLRTFRDAAGLPPHAYLNQLRVARAKLLLREGMPIADVALTLGFSDQSHLNRHFKRIVGVTPGQFVRGIAPSPFGRGLG
jgi:AraC-like DNA-binding protein